MSTIPSSAAARLDERGGALLVGHVERQGEVRLDPLDAPRAARDAHARLAESRTVAAPMPLDAPVTIAVLPSRSMMAEPSRMSDCGHPCVRRRRLRAGDHCGGEGT